MRLAVVPANLVHVWFSVRLAVHKFLDQINGLQNSFCKRKGGDPFAKLILLQTSVCN